MMKGSWVFGLLAAALTGCAPEAEMPPLDFGPVEALPMDVMAGPAGPIDRTLTLDGPDSISPGDVIELTVQGAAPNQLVRIYASTVGDGISGTCLGALNGNCVEVLSPALVAAVRADATGQAVFSGTVVPDLPDGSLWLQAVAARQRGPGTLPNLSEVLELSVIAEPPPFCTTDDDWWPGADLDGDGTTDLGYRILVEVSGANTDFARAPATLDVDFRDVLDSFGETGSFDPNSLRVVRQDCGLELPEVPSQFADRLRALDRKADHLSPVGDEQGAVVFIVDEDGDLSTAEDLPQGETVTFGLYFDVIPSAGPRNRPVYPTDLEVLPGAIWQLRTSQASATFDESTGGLMSTISSANSPPLTSQSDACCGNSMHFWSTTTAPGFPWGWVVPQLGFGTISLVEVGPLITAIRATGTRSAFEPVTGTDYGSYSYDVLYWMFAHRPELHHSISHVALTEVTTEHPNDVSFGFRPVQLVHREALFAAGADYINDDAAPYGVVSGPEWGIAVGLDHPPSQFARVANPVGINVGIDPILDAFSLHGNEVLPPGDSAPMSLPAGTAYFDNIGAVFMPFEGTWASYQNDFDNVMMGTTVTTVMAEAQ